MQSAFEDAYTRRPQAPKELIKRYGSLFGSLLHAVKYRSEIAFACQLLGTCLTYPTEELYECAMRVLVYLGRTRSLGITYSRNAERPELHAYADSN